MATKKDQVRLKELMKEAVTVLCKNKLTFESKFRVEGLLGITVDDKDVMLINIGEDVVREDSNDTCEVYQLTPLPAEEITPKEELAATGSDGEPLVAGPDTSTPNIVSVVSLNPKVRERKRKPIKVLLKDSDSKTESVFGDAQHSNGDKKSFFSPTVDQIIQEYEQQQYSDSTSLMYMAKRRRRKYPSHITELHTQGLLPILPQSQTPMVSILPKLTVGDDSHNIICHQTNDSDAPTIVIKKEPGIDDYEDGLSNQSLNTEGPVQPLTIEPKPCVRERFTPKTRSKGELSSSGLVLTSALDSTTHWVEESILRQEGCFVSTRVMLRRHSSLRGETIVAIMNSMTRSRKDKHYIGEFKQHGRIQVFYKCPPMLLNPEALEPYKLSLDEYTNYFFANPKPPNGTPSQWLSYVNTVLEGVPYNPHLFPVESFDLEGDELEKMNTKRHILEKRFTEGTDGDGSSEFRSFRAEDENS